MQTLTRPMESGGEQQWLYQVPPLGGTARLQAMARRASAAMGAGRAMDEWDNGDPPDVILWGDDGEFDGN